MRRAVKQGPFGDGRGKHLFQTQGLPAELDAVRQTVSMGRAFFVFHRVGPPSSAVAVELHSIRFAAEPQPRGMEFKVCDDPDAVPQPGLPAVDGLVQQASRGGVLVFRPYLFHMDERHNKFRVYMCFDEFLERS